MNGTASNRICPNRSQSVRRLVGLSLSTRMPEAAKLRADGKPSHEAEGGE
jgi:hypothetical protein